MWKNPKLKPDSEIDWLRSLFALRDDPGPPRPPPPPAGFLLDRWRAWFSPIGRLEGCWLEGVVSMANAHTETGAALLRLQTALDRTAENHRRTFQAFPCSEPHPRLHADLTWLNTLARHGSVFLPEILGFTLAHAEENGGVFNLDHSASYQKVAEAAEVALSLVTDQARVQAGSAFYHRLSHSWLSAWEALAGDLRRQVLWLLREKARYGLGHHSHIRLAGRALDDWLKQLAEGRGEEFLEVFPASPERERFLTAQKFGGPMFGVFNQAEQELLRTWLVGATPCGCPESTPCGCLGQGCPFSGQAQEPATTDGQAQEPVPTSARQLYYQLLNLEHFPDCLPAAKRYAQKVLKRAQAKPPFLYSSNAFCRWVEEIYAQQNRPDVGVQHAPLLPKAALRFGIEQLAPAILVDGCWLVKSLHLKRRTPEVGAKLWQIFRDEVGAGDPTQNHANVYRRLLDQAGIQLPPFDSQAFIRHPFLPFAFDLPAFLLAIGQFPEDFLPELLGLNLAIELSGLGSTYRHLAWELESHSLDATIVRLHQSIDNLASGHAALAREAILCHLETLSAGGEEVVQQQWRRIFTGYRAFAVALRRFAWTLAFHFGIRFWLGGRLSLLAGLRANNSN